jgi:hypothetical protein
MGKYKYLDRIRMTLILAPVPIQIEADEPQYAYIETDLPSREQPLQGVQPTGPLHQEGRIRSKITFQHRRRKELRRGAELVPIGNIVREEDPNVEYPRRIWHLAAWQVHRELVVYP